MKDLGVGRSTVTKNGSWRNKVRICKLDGTGSS